MKNEWLAAASFEYMHEVLSAITTLSIQANLRLVGTYDSQTDAEAISARNVMQGFLDQLAENVHDVEGQDDAATVVRADPRFNELVTRYLVQKKRTSRPHGLYAVTLPELRTLLDTHQPEELQQLVGYLHDLRTLVEQHTHADVVELLGDS